MATIAEAIDLAWRHHQAGNLGEAENLYLQILRADPNQADAWCLLGSLRQTQGQLAEAENHLRRAVQIMPNHPSAGNFLGTVLAQQGKLEEGADCLTKMLHFHPGNAEAHNNLGLMRFRQGRLDEAVFHHRQAVQLQPQWAAAQGNLGRALHQRGLLDEAIAHYRQALHLKADYPEVHCNLGSALLSQNKPAEAAMHCRQALKARPDFAQAHTNLASALATLGQLDEAVPHFREAAKLQPTSADACNELGVALEKQGKFEEAGQHFQQAVRIEPGHAGAQNNVGATLLRMRQPAEAEVHFRQAIKLRPSFAEAHCNLGSALRRLGRLEEAVAHCREALRLRPTITEAHNNLGNALQTMGMLDDAMAHYEKALQLQPNYPETRWNRSLLWLMRGDFARGWPEYEWRWQRTGFTYRQLSQPRWDGAALAGKTILLYAEQGLGDTVQFVRYTDLVKQQGGKVIVECQGALRQLLASKEGIDRLVTQGEPLPAFDVQLPLLSLPGIFQTSLATIPASVPYLHVDTGLADRWRQELSRDYEQCSRASKKGTGTVAGTAQGVLRTTVPVPFFDALRIGIAWQGNPTLAWDRYRSIPLRQFAPLAQVKGVRLISLQKGPGTDQVRALTGEVPLLDLQDRLGQDSESLMNIAAVMKSLDVVISCDTVIAHLAGALGVPVWVALPLVPDWRWMLERMDSPWYPTMKLFRQTQLGQWEDVFAKIARELETLALQGFPSRGE